MIPDAVQVSEARGRDASPGGPSQVTPTLRHCRTNLLSAHSELPPKFLTSLPTQSPLPFTLLNL